MAKRFCDQCGELLGPNARFCPGCGDEVTEPALPIRELDDALGLTHIARDHLQECRTGRRVIVKHRPPPFARL